MAFFPIILESVIFIENNSGVNNKDNPWIGFTGGYYGAIFGGLISGLFTFLGVKETLKNKNEINKNKHLLVISLDYTNDKIKQIMAIDKEDIVKADLILDKNWLERLGILYEYIDEKDFQKVSSWFSVLENIKYLGGEVGIVKAYIVQDAYKEIIDQMPDIIERIKQIKI